MKTRLWNKKIEVMMQPCDTMFIATSGQIYADGFNVTENYIQLHSTGLKDENGKEIYDGDILSADRYPYMDEGERNYDLHVEFIHGCWQGVMNLVKTNKRGISDGVNYILDQEGEGIIPFKVIGNIYEGVSQNL